MFFFFTLFINLLYYLQAMLMNSAWSEWRESHIELQEMPICQNVFYTFLEYFYTGKIVITHTNVMPILALADKYLVKVMRAFT